MLDWGTLGGKGRLDWGMLGEKGLLDWGMPGVGKKRGSLGCGVQAGLAQGQESAGCGGQGVLDCRVL